MSRPRDESHLETWLSPNLTPLPTETHQLFLSAETFHHAETRFHGRFHLCPVITEHFVFTTGVMLPL